jgi:DNA (cytosine-5)-methyltransferase 1
VPQSRDRVYLVFWLRDLPAPDLDFHPAAFCDYCECEVQAVQSWKTLFKWGEYREQYVYVCSWCAREIEPFFIPVASVLNLNALGDTLFHRTSGRILVQKTIDGVRKGIERLQGHPFLYAYYHKSLYRSLSEPVGTITTADRWALVHPSARFEETRFRMLTPDEVKLCMGFSACYQVLGTKTEQVWQLGNAVCPPVMADILRRCVMVVALVGEQEPA